MDKNKVYSDSANPQWKFRNKMSVQNIMIRKVIQEFFAAEDTFNNLCDKYDLPETDREFCLDFIEKERLLRINSRK